MKGGRASVLGASLLAAALLCTAGSAGATILTFDQSRSATGATVGPTQAGAAVPQDYGDRVTGSPMAVPGGAFTYGSGGEGFTPNVVVDYFSGGSVSLWTTDYGDLVNVMFASSGSDTMSVRLTADPGFQVLLHGFELGGWLNTDYTIDGVTVTSGATTLFSQSNVLVEGNFTGPRHTAFDFATPLSGSELLIGIDFTGLASSIQDNIGIDNIRFAQDPPPDTTIGVSEPGTIALLGLGLGLLGFLRRAVAG